MNQVEEIKNNLDITEVISNYIDLKQAGSNFKARCPFHNEKTASFMVSKEKQIWHCFGCDKGGDIISFLQEYEGISFREALTILAEKANIVLPEYSGQKKEDYKRMYEINKLTSEFYEKKLKENNKVVKKVKEYLTNRKITEESIEKWQLGLSGESWDELYNYLKNKEYEEEEILKAGLILKKRDGQGYVDRFRKRLMFPLRDTQGRTVAFTSRTLVNIAYQEEEFGGKYINSPQTVIYDKSKILYGWSLAKDALRQKKYIIIVEGNMDAIAASQTKANNVLAVSGTALTKEQIKLIKRYTDNIIFAFDGDNAGSRAVLRGISLGWQEEMNLKVLILPAGKDPADIIKENEDNWYGLLKDSLPVMDYYFQRILAGVDLERADHKKIAVQKLLPIIKFLKNNIEQVHYLKILEKKLDIPLHILEKDLEKSKSFLENKQHNNSLYYEQKKRVRRSLIEKILSIAFYKKEFLEKLIADIELEMIIEPWKTLYEKIIIYYTKYQNLDNFIEQAELNEEERKIWIELSLLGEKDNFDINDKELQHNWELLVKRLKRDYLNKERDKLIQELKQAEISQEKELEDKLVHKINLINNKKNKRKESEGL